MSNNHITGKLVDGQILVTFEEAHRVSMLIDKLEAQNKKMYAALVEIANQDYQGNRPYEQVLAYEYLKSIKEVL